jgi:hypothetical protein
MAQVTTLPVLGGDYVVLDLQRVSADSCEELERHIKQLGENLTAAYARYEQTSCLADRGEAMRYERLQAEAIKARSPEYVRQLELKRGLAK